MRAEVQQELKVGYLTETLSEGWDSLPCWYTVEVLHFAEGSLLALHEGRGGGRLHQNTWCKNEAHFSPNRTSQQHCSESHLNPKQELAFTWRRNWILPQCYFPKFSKEKKIKWNTVYWFHFQNFLNCASRTSDKLELCCTEQVKLQLLKHQWRYRSVWRSTRWLSENKKQNKLLRAIMSISH